MSRYLQGSDHNDDNNINYKNCLHRRPSTPCGKMTHKENLDQSKNYLWEHPQVLIIARGVWLWLLVKQSNFIEIALRHGCSPVNLLHISRTPFTKNTSRWLLLSIIAITEKKEKQKVWHIYQEYFQSYRFYQWTIMCRSFAKNTFVDDGDMQRVTKRFDRNTYCTVSEETFV